ncbi:hypothetical protein AB0M02_10675 [Actinoplanes sp. NPDC051861]|uniref:hypothetical protein n=1 Tax=Actinoplanes sp. NPDC051861 TaxID=3155170 RepID=UPI00343A693E
MATLMRDHAGWIATLSGTHRVMRSGPIVWHLAWYGTPGQLVITPAGNPADARPVVDELIVPARPKPWPAALTTALAGLGPVLRVRNADLWDAIGTAIIRQVIRADQARQMYARFCQAHGEQVDTPHGPQHLFPAPELVAGLGQAAFADLGMRFKHPALTAAATAYLTNADGWKMLPPIALVAALQMVPRIGPWTAGAAAADHTGDFALYPYADLAVRTWARRAAPGTLWPDQEPDFAAHWKEVTGPDLSALTALILAWGDAHVRAP